MKYKGFIISDIHVGRMNIEKLYDEFTKQFINKLKDNKKIDFIIICGDFFDHKLFLNDKESVYAYNMILDIMNACNSNTKIRLVYGTESHECNQYDIVTKLAKINNYDIKLIKYACEEELFPNMHILYLPEEHVYDKNEYYQDFFKEDKKYNYIFGHGIIREAMKEAAVNVETKTNKRKKVPVFSTAEFRRICKGETYFGHYHINTDMNDVFYVGSFSRWQFGEEEPKGFYEIEYNIDKNEYNHKFIQNTMADIYKTIPFGYKNKVFDNMDNMHHELDKIDNLVKGKLFDHVRFDFNIPKECENPEFIINYLNERYKFNDNIKVEITHGYIEDRRKQQKEEVKKDNDKYSFIFDKNLKIEDKTSMFISIEYNRNISSDKISTYLFEPLNKIINNEK